jgi:hypothetical protein
MTGGQFDNLGLAECANSICINSGVPLEHHAYHDSIARSHLSVSCKAQPLPVNCERHRSDVNHRDDAKKEQSQSTHLFA